MKRLAGAVALLCLCAVLPAGASPPVVFGGRPSAEDDLPHLEAAHEWWYFAVQSPEDGPCGPWQAMVSLVRDAEAGADHLLLTTVVSGVPTDRSVEYPRGSMAYGFSEPLPPAEYSVILGDSFVDVDRFSGARYVHAVSGHTEITFLMEATTETLWHRRVPEGAGVMEITLAPRATVSGSLTVEGVVCPVTGLGYFEHVWGTWSRVPMWGVDFLAAHAGGWSVVARRTPMRGETRGLPTNALAKPVMIVTDGIQVFEATETSFAMTESTSPHPALGIPIPTGYLVTGTGFGAIGATSVTLSVDTPTFADILLPLTSSGILEGWAPATIAVDGVSHFGTSEAEFQRYGTSYPH